MGDRTNSQPVEAAMAAGAQHQEIGPVRSVDQRGHRVDVVDLDLDGHVRVRASQPLQCRLDLRPPFGHPLVVRRHRAEQVTGPNLGQPEGGDHAESVAADRGLPEPVVEGRPECGAHHHPTVPGRVWPTTTTGQAACPTSLDDSGPEYEVAGIRTPRHPPQCFGVLASVRRTAAGVPIACPWSQLCQGALRGTTATASNEGSSSVPLSTSSKWPGGKKGSPRPNGAAT
jgi:hypothetical protein